MSWKLPVSVKGIIFHNDRVILLKNERNEWELPGGRLEPGETPEECVRREIREELGLYCSIKTLIDVWVYEVLEDRHVLIVTYLCEVLERFDVNLGDEHSGFLWHPIAELESLPIPKGYMDSIRKAAERFE
ncbi:MAG: NUDIX hydrolase [Brevibacillus sp.]|nr:NUDIX hydrolase [Brevibacillus sp.]